MTVTETMARRKNNTSVLMEKIDNLKSLNVEEIVDEIHKKLPEIFQILKAIMLPRDKRNDPDSMQQIMSRLALLYAVVMITGNSELSRFQHVMPTCFPIIIQC